MTESDATEKTTPNGAPSDNSGGEASPKTASQPPKSAEGKASEGKASEGKASEGKAVGEGETVSFAEPELIADPLETAKADAAKYREQLLRTAADFDNFRKRSRRDNEEATRRGTEKALKELLPVFDNLERATTSASTAPDVKSVADGLKMIGRQFTNTLEKLGIKRIQAVGSPFDPSLHEAIQHVDSTEHPAGVIAVEVQAGYMLGEHLLRAAMVAVSKGPAAEAAPPAAASDETDPAPPVSNDASDEPKGN